MKSLNLQRVTQAFCGLLIAVLIFVGAITVLHWSKSNSSVHLGGVKPRVPQAVAGNDRAAIIPGSTSTTPALDAPPRTTAATVTGEAAVEKLRKEGQYASLGAAFQAARYAVEKIDPAGPHSRGAEYFAANPKQQLRAWFGKQGVELASGRKTDEGGEPWSVQVRLRRVTRADAPTIDHRPSTIQTASAAGSRVEITDPAAGVTQWFENRIEGIEQGFTIHQPPTGGSGSLEVVLGLEGNVRAEDFVQDGAPGVRLMESTGAPVVSYTGLKAWDATGRELPARMERRGGELALLVADAGAQYPVTVDPLFANAEARLIEDPVTSDNFGSSVALSGDTALVGSPYDDTIAGADAGSAYVFVRKGEIWRQQARQIDSEGAPLDDFGFSVAISGDTALVGSPYDDTAAKFNAGSAYVFVRNGMLWSQQEKLKADDSMANDSFGYAVAVSGTTALVGSPYDDTPAGNDAGSAYVFVRNGAAWSPQAHLFADDGSADHGSAGDEFGLSVALSGDTALIGAPFDDIYPSNLASNAGSAYIFVRNGTAWSPQAKLVASVRADSDFFAQSVALSGDIALVGAPFHDTSARSNAGIAYIYVRSGTTWSPPAELTATDGMADDYFGSSVALSGTTALVGAPEDNDPTAGSEVGSAYVFTRSGTTWNPQAKLTASEGAARDYFGSSVALSGETALVGARFDDVAAGIDGGSASVFLRDGTSWSPQSKLTASDGAFADALGSSVALSGNTALVGAPMDDAPAGADAGSAYVFVRIGTNWIYQAKLIAGDGARDDLFGFSVALNVDTALMGAIGADNNVGSAYVFVRSGNNWSEQRKLSPENGAAGDSFGFSVALAGDTALAGSPGDDNERGVRAGSAHVFVRSGNLWSLPTKLMASDGVGSDQFGYSVALSGETALIGAPFNDIFFFGAGRPGGAYVFIRSGTSWSEQAKLAASDGVARDNFGASVALSGDTALVGSISSDTIAGTNAGSAYVFVRSGTLWSPQSKLTASDGAAGDLFGFSVGLSGNVALVGSRYDDTSAGTDAGSAYLFVRDGTLWSQQTKLTSSVDSSASDEFGCSVALDGDLGLVGARGDGTAADVAGSAYIFLIGELPQITQQPVSRTVVSLQSVAFTVVATGYAPLRYQWRKDGFEISGANGPTYSIPAAVVADAGSYDVVISNIGGVVTSAAAVLAVNDLSQFTQSFPGAPPAAQGLVLVYLTPSGIGAGWRFVGEQQWRKSGAPATGLVPGSRKLEFRPVPGFHQPLREDVIVSSGTAATVIEREYYEAGGSGGTGAVTVTLKPDSIADPLVPQAERAQWRLLGVEEVDPGDPGYLTDPSWQNTGGTLANLRPGFHLIEFKQLPERSAEPRRLSTPAALSVKVEGPDALGNLKTSTAIATYFAADAPVGSRPAPFETVTSSTTLPYAYVGQIRSDVGVSSGFVVKERVVATAGHVVFDDAALTYVAGLQWLFQRDRQKYEPKPQMPRGFYVLDGYASARDPQLHPEAVPGQGTPLSQHHDVAVLYFTAEVDGAGNVLDDGRAGRGGFGGFLASDAVDNEWLLSAERKTLVGYPVDGIPKESQGRIHATTPENIQFARVIGEVPGAPPKPFRTYTTTQITSNGGCSGGPLCVEYFDGVQSKFYPAAIYLGGSAQTVVRAIDGEVKNMIDRAHTSATMDMNNTGGGITHVNSTASAAAFNVASLKVTIEPADARAAGAKWGLKPGTLANASGVTIGGIPGGGYGLQFTTVPGFLVPTQPGITLTEGLQTDVTFTYERALPPSLPASANLSGSRTASFAYTPTVSGGAPTSFAATVGGGETLATLGLVLNPGIGRISGTLLKTGTFTLAVTAANASGASEPLVLTLTVGEPGQLIVQGDAARGVVSVSPRKLNNTFSQGDKVTLTAKPKTPGFLFAGWTFDGGTEIASLTSPTTSVKMTETVVAAANFVASPFLTRADAYAGRIAPGTGVTLANTGTLALKVTTLGQITGKLLLGARSYAVKGQFRPDGTAAAIIIKRKGLSDLVLNLTLDLTAGGSERITGTLTDGVPFTFALDRAVYDAKSAPCPQAGTDSTGKPVPATYTMALQRDSTKPADSYPGGHGFGVVTVKPDGTVRFTGRLGDSTGVTQGAMISKTAEWPFHVLLYQREGVLDGKLNFRTVPNVSEVDGTLDWSKPAPTGAPKSKAIYPGGFTGRTSVIGSRYDKTVRVPPGTLHVGSGLIDPVSDVTFAIDASGRIIVTAPKWSLTFTSATGLFDGSFPDPATAKSRMFHGAFLQIRGKGFGFFVGAPLPAPAVGRSSGFVEIIP